MLNLNLYKYLKSVLKIRFYDSIENLPINIWFKVNKEHNPLLITKNQNLFILIFLLGIVPLSMIHWVVPFIWFAVWFIGAKFEVILAKYIYAQIYNEYIERIGLNKDFLEYLNATKQLAMMQCSWIQNPTPILKTRIAEATAELQKKLNQKEVEYSEIIAQVSKNSGFRLDPNSVTVLEFYSYIKDGK